MAVAIRWPGRRTLRQRSDAQRIELKILTGANRPIDVQVDGLLMHGAPAAPMLRITLTDISELNRAETAARVSEASHSALLNVMADGVFVAQGPRFVFANPSLPHMLGYEVSEFVGPPFDAAVAPEFLALWNQRFEQRVGMGPQPDRCCEMQFMARDGRRRLWVELRANRCQHYGKPAVLGLVRDISERRQAERSLRDALDLVQAVEDSVLDHMVVLDHGGNIVNVNAAWIQFATENFPPGEGPSPCPDAGTSYLAVYRVMTGPGREQAISVAVGIEAVLAGERALFTLEYRCDSPDRRRWVCMSVVPMRAAAGGAVVKHADIAQRRQAEDALREGEAQYRSMVSALDEGILLVGVDRRLKACNLKAERFFGATLLELQNTDDLSLWRPLRGVGSSMPLPRFHWAAPCSPAKVATMC